MKVAVLSVGTVLLQLTAARFTQHLNWKRGDADPGVLYPAQNFSIPVDHFHNKSKYEPHSDEMFNNRYWYDDTYYKPGGPVFLLIVGEAAGTLRLPIIQKGIIYQLSKANNGMSVVLEHRYFGTSQPQPDLSVPSLRFLTTDQALEDAVYFAQRIVFPGHEHDKLNASSTPWIAYGGSYAGAFVAFLRTLYPGVFYGAISSSGVTEAIYDYWQYYEPVRKYGPADCIAKTQKLTHMVDNILLGPRGKKSFLISTLKKLFSLPSITYDNDFAQTIAFPIGGWQGRNWDPAVNDPSFSEYCGNLSSPTPLYPNTHQTHTAEFLLAAGGYIRSIRELTTPLLNYIGYINATYAAPCAAQNQTQDQCYSTHNKTYYQQDDWSTSEWRSWPYMYCTQWGYLQTGSGVPHNQLPLLSRTIDLEYLSIICRDAFGITAPPNTTLTNQYGGFDIAYPRLAIIGGQADPWREVTPLAASQRAVWSRRENSTEQPLYLIEEGVHHWDENGLFANETTAMLPPETIVGAQSYENGFVREWLAEAGRDERYK